MAQLNMTNIRLFCSLACTLILSGCAESETDHALESDLTGIWTIEHIDTSTPAFVTTNYNIEIKDDGEFVDIIHCSTNKDMRFTRNEHNLSNSKNQELHIVTGSVIESVSTPGIVQMTKTRKSGYFNAGRIQIESDIVGIIDESSGVCAQKVISSDDPAGFHSFVFSVPYNSGSIEIELMFNQNADGSVGNIELFTLSSFSFLDNSLYGEFKISALTTNMLNASITNSSATIDFDFTTRSYSTPEYSNIAGDNLTGQIQVRY